MVTVQPVHWLEATAHKGQRNTNLIVVKVDIPKMVTLVLRIKIRVMMYVTAVKVPANAHCTSYYSECPSKCKAWACDDGYETLVGGTSCFKKLVSNPCLGICSVGQVYVNNCCCPKGSDVYPYLKCYCCKRPEVLDRCPEGYNFGDGCACMYGRRIKLTQDGRQCYQCCESAPLGGFKCESCDYRK